MEGMQIPSLSRQDWAIVLAAGDGTRLRGLAVDRGGRVVPKQFCTLRGSRTLLGDAVHRALRVVPAERVVVVVAAQHRQWWERESLPVPQQNIIVQPQNRGTASGILLPLLSILERDRGARILVLPSDHFVEDEAVLARAARTALQELHEHELVLLGITPDHAETEYGWIVPALDGSDRVSTFVEKPDRAQADACLRRNGVWNSFLFAAIGKALLDLYERRVPELTSAFRAAWVPNTGTKARALEDLYATMGTVDFSRAVLQGSEPYLRLRVVPSCGWTDLGTPERVARCVDNNRHRHSVSASRSYTSPDLSLALEQSRQHRLSDYGQLLAEIRP